MQSQCRVDETKFLIWSRKKFPDVCSCWRTDCRMIGYIYHNVTTVIQYHEALSSSWATRENKKDVWQSEVMTNGPVTLRRIQQTSFFTFQSFAHNVHQSPSHVLFSNIRHWNKLDHLPRDGRNVWRIKTTITTTTTGEAMTRKRFWNLSKLSQNKLASHFN